MLAKTDAKAKTNFSDVYEGESEREACCKVGQAKFAPTKFDKYQGFFLPG